MTDTIAPELYKELPRRILETLEAELGDMFNVYFDGEPVLIGLSHLPALIVDVESSSPLQGPTGHDRWLHSIVLKVCVNKMDDAALGDMTGEANRIIDVPTKQRLQKMIFAKDSTTRQYITNSVMGVLRRNFTMDGTISDQKVTVEYGNSQRPGFSDGGTVVTSEAHLRFDAREQIPVANRT